MSKLTRKERLRRQRQNDPTRVTRPLTPKLLRKETNAATREKFAPVEQEIAGQQRSSDAQQGRIDDWFGNYQAQALAAEERTKALNAQAQADVTARQAAAQTGDDQARAQLQQQAQADAAARGATVDPQTFAADAQAGAARRASTDSYGALLASQGAAQGAYMADKTRIGAGERANQHVLESGRRRTIDKSLEDVARQKGEFRIGYKAEARDKERKYGLERAAFDLDSYEAQAQVADEKADRKADRKKEGGKVNQWGYTNAEWVGMSVEERQAVIKKQRGYGKSGKGTAPESPASLRAEKNRIAGIREKSGKGLTRLESARSDWESLVGSKVETGEKDDDGNPKTRPITPTDIRAELRRRGFSAPEIDLMLKLRAGQKWGPADIVAAHRLGIRVPREYILSKPKHIPDRKSPAGGQ